MKLLFPTILVVLSIAAGVVYLVGGDWKHATYWFAAATINLMVILM